MPRLLSVLAIIGLSAALIASSQLPPQDSFYPRPNGPVFALAVQEDGKVLVGGAFTQFTPSGGGVFFLERIARLYSSGYSSGQVDPSFNPSANGPVRALAVQADGKILVAGSFTSLGGQPRVFIGRLNPDGTLDSGFNPGANNSVYALAVQPDGKILMGGLFTSLNGQPRNFIGRLNADGSLDASFDPGADAYVLSLAVQADGKIVVGGAFTMLAGNGRNFIGRLYENGTPDGGFYSYTDYLVRSLLIQPDGRILVGGEFLTLGTQPRSFIGRIDASGVADGGFNPGANGPVHSLAMQADRRILVGGAFTSLGGQPRSRVGRLIADGTLDPGFNPGSAGPVYSLAVQSDGKVLLGGESAQDGGFLWRLHSTEPADQDLSYDGSAITWLRGGTSPEVWRTTFEHSTDGTNWTFLGAGTRIPGGWRLTGVSLAPNGTLRARGYALGGVNNASSWFVQTLLEAPVLTYQTYDQTVNFGTAVGFSVGATGSDPLSFRWFKDGMPLSDGSNITGTATAVLAFSQPAGADSGGYHVVVSNSLGSVTSVVATLTVVEPIITSQPASQQRDAGQSATFSVSAVGTEPLAYQWLKDGLPLTDAVNVSGATTPLLMLTNLGKFDAGQYRVLVNSAFGSATSAVVLLTVNIATLDTGFNSSTDGQILSLAVQVDGKILVGGSFGTLNGQSRSRIGRLNADGTLDNGFYPSANGAVYSLVIQADGKILVAGQFTTLSGQPRNYIGRLNEDGTLDSGFNPGANDLVFSLAMQPSGQLVVGGFFTALSGQNRSRIARLNPGGTLDGGFNAIANSSVYSLAVEPDGKILVGGTFTTLVDQPRNYIGRLNEDGTLDSGFNPGADSIVAVMVPQPDGKILVGGGFNTLAGQQRSHIGRLNVDGTFDTGFSAQANGWVSSLAVGVDGTILVGGGFTTLGGQPRMYFGKLNSAGAVDINFGPTSDNVVTSLALQADGKVLVGGSFTTLAGLPRNGIGRLINSEPATQSLNYDGSTITWLRGGTSPEVWRTTFEGSTNGTDWTLLGAGTRIPGGWQLGGVSLSPEAIIRARGFVVGGYQNASSWVVETRWQSICLANPHWLGSTNFTFTLQAATNGVYRIDASTNLASWAEVLRVTNPPSDMPIVIPVAPGQTRQFYRAVQP